MKLNIPNTLTLFRVLLIPIIILLHKGQVTHISFILLMLTLMTDFLDGYLARKLNQETEFGALFDPIADRIMALGLYGYIGLEGLAPTWFVLIILARNFSQLMCVPILIWWLKRSFKVRPSMLAKTITAISDIYILVPLFVINWFGISGDILVTIMVIIGMMEFYILVTYVPRLIGIAIGTHDTFT